MCMDIRQLDTSRDEGNEVKLDSFIVEKNRMLGTTLLYPL